MTSLTEIYQEWKEEENKITLAWINNKEELLQKINLCLPENFRAEWDKERENIQLINSDGLITNFPCHIDESYIFRRGFVNNPYMEQFDKFCEKYRTALKLDIYEIVFSPGEILSAIQRELPERYSVTLEPMSYDEYCASLKLSELPWSLNFIDNWRNIQIISQTFTRHGYNFYEAKRIKTWALNKIKDYEKKHKSSYSKEQLLGML